MSGSSGAFPSTTSLADALPRLPPAVQQPELSSEEVNKATENMVKQATALLREHMAYELIPHSGKVVVLDSQLGVLSAFHGLLENNINCAPVWNSQKHKYVGMLSVTDFIDILQHLHSKRENEKQNEAVEGGSVSSTSKLSMEKHTIADWQEIKRGRGTSTDRLLCISPECSLHEAVRLLIEYRIHRLCVVQLALGNTVLCVLSQHHILRYICQQLDKVPCLSVADSKIGQFKKLPTIRNSTPLVEVLELMMKHKLSGIAVVDDSGVVVGHYTRADTRVLATSRSYDRLDIPVEQALKVLEALDGERVLSLCYKTDDLWAVCSMMLNGNYHGLICVDEKKKFIGIVSMTDIFVYMLGEAGAALADGRRRTLSVNINPTSKDNETSSKPSTGVEPSTSKQNPTTATPEAAAEAPVRVKGFFKEKKKSSSRAPANQILVSQPLSNISSHDVKVTVVEPVSADDQQQRNSDDSTSE